MFANTFLSVLSNMADSQTFRIITRINIYIFINGNPNTGVMHIHNFLICVFRRQGIIYYHPYT
jgi:hypothetical protein